MRTRSSESVSSPALWTLEWIELATPSKTGLISDAFMTCFWSRVMFCITCWHRRRCVKADEIFECEWRHKPGWRRCAWDDVWCGDGARDSRVGWRPASIPCTIQEVPNGRQWDCNQRLGWLWAGKPIDRESMPYPHMSQKMDLERLLQGEAFAAHVAVVSRACAWRNIGEIHCQVSFL